MRAEPRAVQGNWAITLLEYGQHKRTYLSVLDERPSASARASPREASALEASREQLRQEARQALVRAGQLFREVVQVGGTVLQSI